MTQTIPDYGEVATAALGLTQRHPNTVDRKILVPGVIAIQFAQLRDWSAKHPIFNWDEVQLVLGRPARQPTLLSDYLSAELKVLSSTTASLS